MLSRLFNVMRNTKEPPPFSGRTVTALGVLAAIYVIHEGFGHHNIPSLNCEKGPLATIDTCLRNNSPSSAATTQVNWNYSYASGTVSADTCNQLSLDPSTIHLNLSDKLSVALPKTECEALNTDNNHFCYSGQRLTPDGVSRMVLIFTANEYCGDAHFFYGHNVSLTEKTIRSTSNWQKPYAGIPEIVK